MTPACITSRGLYAHLPVDALGPKGLPTAMHRQGLILSVVLSWLLAADCQAEPPSVSHVEPIGIVPGEAVSLTFHGTNLDGAGHVWSTLPATVEFALSPGPAGPGSCTVNLPSDLPLGIHALRFVTSQGVSNASLVMVDDLATVRESDKHASIEEAQEFHPPAAIDGGVEAGHSDFYTFHASAGQRLAIEVVARRLGSPLDAVVRLLDRNGRELAHADDNEITGPDPQLVYRITHEGDYTIELRDIRHEGGAGYRYRLRVGDFPLAGPAFPLAGRAGSTASVIVDRFPALEVPIRAEDRGKRMAVPIRYAEGQGSSLVPFLASDTVEQVEFEPNDTPDHATVIDAPGAINGRFDKPHDRDYWEFTAKKGDRLQFVGCTRALGAPTDLYMRLFDADGKQLAEIDDSGVEEGVLRQTIPADGVYRLAIEELLHRDGPQYVYRVEILPADIGFELSVDAERYNVPCGGTFTMKVVAVRRSFDGPIQLSFEGADTTGWKLVGGTLATGKPSTTMTVTIPESIAPGEMLDLRLVGTAVDGKKTLSAMASTLTALRASFNGLAYPPESLVESIALGIGPKFADFFELTIDSATARLPQRKGAASLVVKAKRLEKFDDKITVRVDGLPEEFSAKPVTIEKGKDTATFEITGPKAAALVKFPLRIVGTATHQNQTKTVAVAGSLEVVAPGRP
ncbi:MAG TPA: PPC domain-containing protein [Pirellulales bacterium]|nr:PPC domain-containing protein [Pirellulales bacterium]